MLGFAVGSKTGGCRFKSCRPCTWEQAEIRSIRRVLAFQGSAIVPACAAGLIDATGAGSRDAERGTGPRLKPGNRLADTVHMRLYLICQTTTGIPLPTERIDLPRLPGVGSTLRPPEVPLPCFVTRAIPSSLEETGDIRIAGWVYADALEVGHPNRAA